MDPQLKFNPEKTLTCDFTAHNVTNRKSCFPILNSDLGYHLQDLLCLYIGLGFIIREIIEKSESISEIPEVSKYFAIKIEVVCIRTLRKIFFFF